jgi:hypothetical protein
LFGSGLDGALRVDHHAPMDATRLSSQLHRHYSGLVAYSELTESDLSHLARTLAKLPAEEAALRRTLALSPVTRWRLAAGSKVWTGEQASSEFLSLQHEIAVDSWIDAANQVHPALIEELLRGV